MLEKGESKDVHPLISDVFMEAATEAIDTMTDVSF